MISGNNSEPLGVGATRLHQKSTVVESKQARTADDESDKKHYRGNHLKTITA